MTKDRRSLYVWILVIIANISFYIVLLSRFFVYEYANLTLKEAFVYAFDQMSLTIVAFSLAISAIPALISQFNFKGRSVLGYGIPTIVILYSIIHYYTCTGKLCNIADVPLGIGGFIFGVFYVLGIYLRKIDEKFSKILIAIEIVIALAFLLYTYSMV